MAGPLGALTAGIAGLLLLAIWYDDDWRVIGLTVTHGGHVGMAWSIARKACSYVAASKSKLDKVRV